MKSTSIFYFFLLSLTFISCGIRTGFSSVNNPLPGPFVNRTTYPNDLAGAERFQDLVGGIVIIKQYMDPLMVGLIRPPMFISLIKPITDPNTYYKSRVQKGGEAQGSYLAFAAKFSVEDMAELELIDAAWSGITYDVDSTFEHILRKAEAWVASHPKSDTSVKRIWIKEVTLTRQLYSSLTKIKSNASGVVGPVVGVKAGVYNSNENVIKSVILGLVAYDIDQMVAQGKRLKGIAGSTDQIMKLSAFTNSIIDGKINFSIENEKN